MWRFCTGSGLSALWRAGSGFPMDPGTSEAVPLPRAPTQVPWRRSACPTPTFPEDGRCLPPPRPNPKARGRPVRAPSAIGESGWASRGDRASQICTRATGRRVRHFGGRHRTSYSSIRCLRGACRHGPHGEVGGVPIPVLGWSRQPLYGSGRGRRPLQPAFQRGGTQPTPSGLYRGRARRGCLVGLGRGAAPLGVCSASLRERWDQGRLQRPFFYPQVPTTRFRAQLSVACGPRRAVRAPVCDARRGGPRRDEERAPLTPRGRRAGRPSVQQGSYHRHGLRRSPGHLCSWLSSCMPLGTGLPRTRRPSTAAPHPPAAPGRRAASRFDRRRCG